MRLGQILRKQGLFHYEQIEFDSRFQNFEILLLITLSHGRSDPGVCLKYLATLVSQEVDHGVEVESHDLLERAKEP